MSEVDLKNTKEKLDVCSQIVLMCRKYDTKPCEKKYSIYASWIRQLRHRMRMGEDIQIDLERLYQELEAHAMHIEKECNVVVISVAIQDVRFKCLTKYLEKKVFLKNSLEFLEKQGFASNQIEMQAKDILTYIRIQISPALSNMQWITIDVPSEKKILSLVVDSKSTIKQMEFITSVFAETQYQYGRELWEDEDIKRAEYFLSLITGRAWIETDPLGFIKNMFIYFSNQVPGHGFEISYLEQAAQLYDLYGSVLAIMEHNDVIDKKSNDNTQEKQTIKDIAYMIKDIVL